MNCKYFLGVYLNFILVSIFSTQTALPAVAKFPIALPPHVCQHTPAISPSLNPMAVSGLEDFALPPTRLSTETLDELAKKNGAFISDGLPLLHPDQSATTFQKTWGHCPSLSIMDTYGKPMISAVVRPYPDGTLWIAAFMVNPHASESEIKIGMRQVMQEIKKRYPHTDITTCVSQTAHPFNSVARRELCRAKLHTSQEYITLTRAARVFSAIKYRPSMFKSFSVHSNRAPNVPDYACDTLTDAHKVLTHPQVLPFFACSADDVTSYLTHEKRKTHVAYVNQKPVAAVVTHLASPRLGTIEFLGVLPEYQGKKIGSYLLELASANLKKRGFRNYSAKKTLPPYPFITEINVKKTNVGAFQMYQKLGFEVTTHLEKRSKSKTPQPKALSPSGISPRHAYAPTSETITPRAGSDNI